MTAIWEVLCEPIWELRNSQIVLREQQALVERIEWFQRFLQQVLAQSHRWVIDFETEEVSKWDRKQCRKVL